MPQDPTLKIKSQHMLEEHKHSKYSILVSAFPKSPQYQL